MKGIPTKHKHIQYRSRLEATWAAFFDELGWDYEYEPYDLDGWVPDFAIFGKKRTILVEVKPFMFEEQWKGEVKTICNSNIDVNENTVVLLLGVSPFKSIAFYQSLCIGYMIDATWSWDIDDKNNRWLDEETYPCIINHCGEYGLFNESMGWNDIVLEKYDGNKYVIPADTDDIQKKWANAKNKVQWRKPLVT